MPEFFTVSGIILAAIALLTLFILSLRGTLTVEYKGEFALSFRVLFFNLKLLPVKERTKHYRRSMSRRKAKRIRKQVAQREERKNSFKEKLFGKKQKKTEDKKGAEQGAAEKKERPDIPVSLVARETVDILSAFTEIIAVIVKRFTHHLRVKIARFKIKIATEDPAITAVTYGAATGIINVLLPILATVENLGLPKEKDLDISTDFTSTTPEIDLKVTFSLRTWHIADIAIRTVFGGISKYVGRKGGIDKTFAHISDIISSLSPKN